MVLNKKKTKSNKKVNHVSNSQIQEANEKHNKTVFIFVSILIFGVVIGVILLNKSTKIDEVETVEVNVCNISQNNETVNSAVKASNSNNNKENLKGIEEIETLAGYENDSICFYLLTIMSINISDYEKANSSYKEFSNYSVNNNELKAALGSIPLELDKIASRLDNLKKNTENLNNGLRYGNTDDEDFLNAQ